MPAYQNERTHYYFFENGRLIIRKAGKSDELIIDAWPEPKAVLRERYGAYSRNLLPPIRLLKPYWLTAAKQSKTRKPTVDKNQPELALDVPLSTPPQRARPLDERDWKQRAFAAYRFALPREVAKAAEHFRSHQFALIALLAYDPSSLDLARSNPALAYLAAQWLQANPRRIKEARPGSIPQRNLMALMGAEASQAAVNILRKVEPQSIHGGNWRQLLDLLSNPDDLQRKLLFHVPAINEGVLGLVLGDRARHVAPSLLAEVAADKSARYQASAAAMLNQFLELQQAMHRPPPQRQFRSVQEVTLALDQAHVDFRAFQARVAEHHRQLEHGPLPAPPLEGLPGKIEPITTREDLHSEGQAQDNCVASYARRVALGQCYIYRIFWPERASLSIIPGPSDEWTIGELETASNQPASKKTFAFVQHWLNSHLVGI